MSLRFVNGKWKGGTKKDAAKLKASSKISSSNKSSRSSGSKKSSGSYNQNQYASYKMVDNMMGTNMADTYARAYGASNKMQGPLMESGAFYSKESSDSDRNKKIRSDRNNAYRAATKKTTPTYTSNSPSSNRSLASKAYDWFNKITGTKTAQARSTAPVGTGNYNKSKWERAFEIMSDPFGLEPRARALYNDKPWGTKVYEKEQDNPLVDEGNVLGVDTYKEPSAPAPYLNWDTFNTTQGNEPTNRTDTRRYKTTDTSTASPEVYESYTPDYISQDVDISENAAPQSDENFIPIQPENATVQRYPGHGYFSTGQYGNGRGDYGLTGAYGTGMAAGNPYGDEEELLGTDPSLASEMGVIASPEFQNVYGAGLDDPEYDLSSPDIMEDIGQLNDGVVAYKLATGQDYTNDGANTDYGYDTTGNKVAGVFNAAANQIPVNTSISNNDMEQTNKSSSSSDEEKAQKKAYKANLKKIKSQYKTSREEATQELNKSKQEDLMRLSGMFNFANSDPNDEQRAQYMTRTMNDYSGQLSGLLKKLAAAESQDISGAESNYQNALAQIAQARAAAQAKVQQSLRAAQQQQFNNMAKMYSLLQKNRGQAKTAASNSPYPVSRGYDEEGNPLYVDGNRYSPTYGQQIYWQE